MSCERVEGLTVYGSWHSLVLPPMQMVLNIIYIVEYQKKAS